MTKPKAAIVTIYGENNYGNKLQNYAVSKVLQGWGYEPVTLAFHNSNGLKLRLKKACKRFACILLGPFITKKKPTVMRTHKFSEFTRKHVKTKYICRKSIDTLGDKYDVFVAGSDQIWNVSFEFISRNIDDYLLSFAAPEKRHSFSASFGMEALPDGYREKFKTELSKFVNLSSREALGTEIIKELTGRTDVKTTIDPTLMLDKNEWLRLASSVKNIPSEYELDYFLGSAPEDDLTVNRVKLRDLSDKNYYISGPGEFIYLVSKASSVRTDSFHACVFAILFSKPVTVYKREGSTSNMFARMETLFGMFGIDINEHVGKQILVDEQIRDEVLKEKREKMREELKL